MRRKMLMLILPIMCVVVFAGASLGMWFFGPLSSLDQTGTGVQVEGMANYYGLVTIPNKNDIKIVVHQKGIQLNQQIKLEYDPDTYNFVKENMDYLYDVYVPEEVHNYIQVHSNRLSHDPVREVKTVTENGQTKNIVVFRYTGSWEIQGSKQVPDPNKPGQTKTIYTFTTELSFGYQDGMKPLNKVDVTNIFKILNHKTIVAKFEIRPKAGVTPTQ